MNQKGVKAGKNEPELVARTDLAHTIAHATGITHDCHVKPTPDPKDTKQAKSPEVKLNQEAGHKHEVKPEETPKPKPEEEVLKSLKKAIEDNELRKLVLAILEETEEARKKALQTAPDWAQPSRLIDSRKRSPEFFNIR